MCYRIARSMSPREDIFVSAEWVENRTPQDIGMPVETFVFRRHMAISR